MIHSVKVRNTTSRSAAQPMDGDVITPRMAFDQAEIPMGNTVSLNCKTLSAADLDTPISQLTADEDVLIASVVKADGAC